MTRTDFPCGTIEDQLTPEEILIQQELRTYLITVLATLPSQREYILRAYFGFDGRGGLTLGEIGQELNKNKRAIHQAYKRALQNLEDKLLEHPFTVA